MWSIPVHIRDEERGSLRHHERYVARKRATWRYHLDFTTRGAATFSASQHPRRPAKNRAKIAGGPSGAIKALISEMAARNGHKIRRLDF